MKKSEYFIDKQSMKELGLQLFLLRQEKHLRLHNVSAQTHIPDRIIDGIETGRSCNYGVVRKLLTFYGKKMKIVFEW